MGEGVAALPGVDSSVDRGDSRSAALLTRRRSQFRKRTANQIHVDGQVSESNLRTGAGQSVHVDKHVGRDGPTAIRQPLRMGVGRKMSVKNPRVAPAPGPRCALVCLRDAGWQTERHPCWILTVSRARGADSS